MAVMVMLWLVMAGYSMLLRWLWLVIVCYRWLWLVGYSWVIVCYRWLWLVIAGYRWLWVVIVCYSSFLQVSLPSILCHKCRILITLVDGIETKPFGRAHCNNAHESACLSGYCQCALVISQRCSIMLAKIASIL